MGLLASTLGRLYSSTYYALRDTRTPLRFAIVRVVLTTAWDTYARIPLPGWLGIDPRWGVAGLTASAGVAGWVEFTLLRRALNRRIGSTGLPVSLTVRLWGSAAAAAARMGRQGHARPQRPDPRRRCDSRRVRRGLSSRSTWVGEVEECPRVAEARSRRS